MVLHWDEALTHGCEAGRGAGAVLCGLPHQLVHRGQLVDASTMDLVHG